MLKTYNVDDKVWYAGRESTVEKVVCPECFDKKYLTVILGDDSQVTIDCAGCSKGYDPPKGYITYFKQSVKVELVTIDRVEIDRDYVEYAFNKVGCHCNIAKNTDIFSTKEGAENRAKELAEEHNKEQLAKIHQKKKNDRDWSWHVHYYRKMIRDAEKTIEDAKKKLDVAKDQKFKEKALAIAKKSDAGLP